MIGELLKQQEADIVKKPVAFFTACDDANFQYAIPFYKSLTKFHSPKDIDMFIYTTEKRPEQLQRLPEGIKVIDITPFLEDPMFWYRQKPTLMEPLLDYYDLVIGFDADQLIVGDLNPLLEAQDFDAGVVINWNRHDEKFFPIVELGRLGIPPIGFYNCGLVALRSKKFAHIWKVNCFNPEFNYMQYKEQDLLTIMAHFGNWNVRCFDLPDGPDSPVSWYGIVGKGEWCRAVVEDGKVMVKKGFGSTPFPPSDTQIRVLHMGGGTGTKKDNWSALCSKELMERIEELIK